MNTPTEHPKYSRLTIKGGGLKYSTVLPLYNLADIIAYLDKNYRQYERKTIPRGQEKQL